MIDALGRQVEGLVSVSSGGPIMDVRPGRWLVPPILVFLGDAAPFRVE